MPALTPTPTRKIVTIELSTLASNVRIAKLVRDVITNYIGATVYQVQVNAVDTSPNSQSTVKRKGKTQR